MIFWILFFAFFIISIIGTIYIEEETNRIENSCKEIHNPETSIQEQKLYKHCYTYPQTYNITKFQWMWEK